MGGWAGRGKVRDMRLLLLFPLAFVCGMDGFLLFAPYLLFIVAMGHLAGWWKSGAAARREWAQAARANRITPLPVLAWQSA